MESQNRIISFGAGVHLNCYTSFPTSSAGFWFGDSPFQASLPLLMTQVSLIVSISSVIHHYVFRHIYLPSHLSQILTGILLGPSLLGRFQSFKEVIFPEVSYIQLNTVALVGGMLYIFMISVKTDLAMVRKSGKKAVAMAFFGTLTSCSLVMLARQILKSSTPEDLKKSNIFIGIASTWSISAYVNLSFKLEELNLLNSKLGRLAMSISLITECIDMIVVKSIIGSIDLGRQSQSTVKAWGTMLSFVGMILYILFIARPITKAIIRRTREGELLDEPHFIAVIVLAFSCSLISEVIGHHGIVGIIIYGLVLPSGPPLGTTLAHRLEGLIYGLYVPVYMSGLGLRMDLGRMFVDVKKWGYVQLGLIVSMVGKLIGVMAPALYCKMPPSEALTVGLMLNIKGFYEIDALYMWQDHQVTDDQTSAVVLCTLVVLTAVLPPVIKMIYKPSMTYLAYKRRSVQHVKRTGELRVLACIHNQETVSPVINLAGASYPTKDNPISIYLLHLIPSIGHAAAVLLPYDKNSTSNTAETNHIVNAFKFAEQQSYGCVSVQPFVSISPYATMHDDVCNLAVEKKVSLVVVPFHKQMAIDGTMESVNPAHQTINVNILNYAPCSVGILVDHGGLAKGGANFALSNQAQQNIGVYFLGGPDDHEALACGMRMVHNPTAHLTVIRFRSPEEDKTDAEAAEEDDEIINEYRLIYNMRSRSERVVYQEEEVRDGEEMVSVIRKTSNRFGLLIVGRRQRKESALMEGLSSWSECPELGVIGDILAPTDFGTRVSILVVQQQGAGKESAVAGSLRRHERFTAQVHPTHHHHRHPHPHDDAV